MAGLDGLGKDDLRNVIQIKNAIRDVKSDITATNKDENKFESYGLDYHQKISKGFNNLAKNNKERIQTIDASDTIENISKKIINFINLKLKINV